MSTAIEQSTIPRFYTKEETLALVKRSYRTILRWVDDKGFPKPRLFVGANVFMADAVDAWVMKELGVD